jgi:hypothetical protein
MTDSQSSSQALDELKPNALNTVRFAEFRLHSCHRGINEVIRAGEQLVPFLSRYMPQLQTLRLWRIDDFLWTSRKYHSQNMS